ncbi:MAG: hypothetical protein PUC37_08680 [Spirochaetales bacterium]|nr:hypothetical protein [Spirochaetales bacterium]
MPFVKALKNPAIIKESRLIFSSPFFFAREKIKEEPRAVIIWHKIKISLSLPSKNKVPFVRIATIIDGTNPPIEAMAIVAKLSI